MFRGEPWHGLDPEVEEGDTEDEDEEWKTVKPTVPYPDPVAVYLYWRAHKGLPVPSFAPAWNPQSLPLYNAAVGLAEIGVVQQLVKGGSMPEGTSPHTGGQSQGDDAKMPAWVWTAITGIGATAWMLANLPGGPGGKMKALRTAARVPYFVLQGDLIKNVSRMMREGFTPVGNEVVQEKIPEQWYNQHHPYRYMHGSSPGG